MTAAIACFGVLRLQCRPLVLIQLQPVNLGRAHAGANLFKQWKTRDENRLRFTVPSLQQIQSS